MSKFPSQVRFILGNEACERFSFYGMRGILVGYVVSVLAMSEDSATEIAHFFNAFVYLTPLLGAFISDQLWGRYKTILYVSLLYCLGHGTLALSDFSPDLTFKKICLFAGLTFIVFGAGGIKPCVSAFMGDQFRDNDTGVIARAYAAFYWCINLGSLGAFIIIPFVKDAYGYGWAFGIPGIFMAIATFIFWLGRKHYTHIPPAQKNGTRAGFLRVLTFALLRKERAANDTFWSPARRHFSEQAVTDVIGVLRVLWVFLLIPPFFALFDQTSSTWLFQGNQMTPVPLFGFTINAEQMQSANPALIMVLIPLLTLGIYPFLGKFASPLRRISLGMFITAVSFFIVGWLQNRIENHETLSLAWQFWPYLALTVAEILVSTTGLEFAYTQAPRSMKSIITSFWLLTSFAGNLIVVGITYFGGNDTNTASASSERFFLYAALMTAAAVLFSAGATFYKYRATEPVK